MTAILSDCGQYRFLLGRDLEPATTMPVRLLYIMQNPSTADAEADDPTIRRCKHFAAQAGYTSFEVVNLFAYRTKSPKVLADAGYPAHPKEHAHMVEAMKRANAICCAWGAVDGKLGEVAFWVKQILLLQRKPVLCLGKTKAGHPRHPLYVPNSTNFQSYP